MKSVVLKILVLLLCVSSAFFNVVDKVDAKRLIKVGYVDNYGTVIEPIVENQEGYGYDYFKEISKYTGWEYEFIKCDTWQQALEMLQNEQIDLLGQVGSDIVDRGDYIITNNNFGQSQVLLLADDDSEVGYNDITSFNNKTIAVTNEMFIPYMETYANKNNIKCDYVTIPLDGSFNDLFGSVFDYRISIGQNVIKDVKVVAKLGYYDNYYAAKSSNVELINELDQALEEIHIDNYSFESNLYSKYYKSIEYATPVLSQEEENILNSVTRITVGYPSGNIPISYQDENGKEAGVACDIVKKIFEKTNIELQFIPFESEEECSNKNFDICLSFSANNNTSGFVKKSTPYLQSSLMLYGPESTFNSDNYKIGVIKYRDFIGTELYKEYQDHIVYYDTLMELRNALYSNEINMVVSSSIAMQTFVDAFDYQNYRLYGTQDSTSYSIYYSTTFSDEFIRAVDKLIEGIGRETTDSIITSNAIKSKTKTTLMTLFKNNPIQSMWIVAVCISSIFGLLILFQYRLTKKQESELNVDKVTGLISMKKFREDVTKKLEGAGYNQYMIIAVEIDNFNVISELYGYTGTKLVLNVFGQKIKAAIKQEALVARISTDKFIIFMEAIPFTEIDNEINLYSKIDRHFSIENVNINYFTLSMGVYYISNTKMNIDLMIDNATIARDQPKDTIGDTIVEYTDALRTENVEIITIISQIQAALDNNEFKLNLQPRFSYDGSKIIGAEVLTRWHSKTKILQPKEFLPIFEKSGFIYRYDLHILEQVCKLISDPNNEILNNLKSISLNISKQTLINIEVCQDFKRILDQYELGDIVLELEVTDLGLIEKDIHLETTLLELKRYGFKITIDNYSINNAPLEFINKIPFDSVKIDMMFVEQLNHKSGKAFVRSTIDLLKTTDTKIILKNIDSNIDLQELTNISYDYVQGYYFENVLTIDEFKELLINKI